MVKYCVAYNCKNSANLKNKSTSFHRFPLTRPELLKRWVNAVHREYFQPTKCSRLCSDHFTDDSYQLRPGYATRRLKEDAVPTVFNYSSYMQRPEKRRKLLKPESPDFLPTKCTPIISIEKDAEQRCDKNDSPPPCPQQYQAASHMPSPTKAKLRKKIKNLQDKLRRRNKKISSMKELLLNLKKNGHNCDNLHQVLETHFSGFPLEMVVNQFKNEAKHKSKKSYSPTMKQFALTLYFYSPKAYKYVRSLLHLPHPSRIKNWISSVKCEPGFLSEVFDYLKTKVKKDPFLKNCCLIFDSMSIRKQLIWNPNVGKHSGYVDCGGIAQNEHEELAKEALVLQIVSLTGSFKCAVGYFLINKITATLQCQILKVCIAKLFDVGIVIHSVTCDGTSSNVRTLTDLGCNFEVGEDFKTTFKHPSTSLDIFTFLDPCHMLKLARNTLAEMGFIKSNIGIVKWEYITKLNDLQKIEDLKFANSLSGAHIFYENKKMNVRLAAQTLSSSVADALEHLSKSDTNFKGSAATIYFLRIIDRLFDCLNSRNPFSLGFKQPLRLLNRQSWETFLKETFYYISSLEIGNVSVLKHPRKTFALGFLICIESVQKLAMRLMQEIETPCKYFLTYKISQDHVELLFSCIRSKGGNNNNPNVNQFKYALRKLLFRNTVCPSTSANCLNLDNTSQCSIFEFRSSKRSLNNCIEDVEDDTKIEELSQLIESSTLSDVTDNILYYISGYVVKKLSSKLTCAECLNLLVYKSKLEIGYCNNHTYGMQYQQNAKSFTCNINKGGLKLASDGVLFVVQQTEKLFRHYVTDVKKPKHEKILDCIVYSVSKYVSQANIVKKLNSLGFVHSTEGEFIVEDLHQTQLIKLIARVYANIRLFSNAKKVTLDLQKNKTTIRHKLNKLVLFNNV